MDICCVAAPAKINLFLRVIGKRSDGYHNLCSLMCPVALHDRLTLKPGGNGIHVVCHHPNVPQDASNLALRAAALFLATAFAGRTPAISGLTIHIQKTIPVGAGLGGGSSNAATVLKTLNHCFGDPLDASALRALGRRIGADVPFFIAGVPAVATGIGDRLAPYPYLPPLTAVLVYPNQPVSTAWVFKNLNLRLTKEEKITKKPPFDGRRFNVGEHLVNDLEAVTEKAFPVISTIKRLLLDHGADGAMMTGSGSTVFGLFRDSERAVSARTALAKHPQSRNWALYVADLLI